MSKIVTPQMKHSNALLPYAILSLLILVIGLSSAKPYQEIHHLLTEEEREGIFGHTSAEYVQEYDITHPVQVDINGRFLSRDLANGNSRRKRDIGSPSKESVFFKMSAFGQDYQLNVTLNDVLFSPHFEMEVRGNGSSEFHYDIEHCHYIGQLLPKDGETSKVAVSNCDGLKGMIRTLQDLFLVHPLPARLGLEKNKTRAHVIQRRSLTPLQALGMAMTEEERSEKWCGVKGTSKFQQSDNSSKTSHAIFRRSADVDFARVRTIESMVVVEKVMTKFYGVEAIRTYVPTLVNIAHGLLADASIGANIKYVIQKLLILEDDVDGLVLENHAASTLSNFCNWTIGRNTADDSDPAHFDHAALFAKYDFCRDKKGNKKEHEKAKNEETEGCGTILGLADLKGMCKRGSSCTLSKDTGLGTAFTLAHETGHNLGAEHDSEGNKCSDGVNIMATKASGKLTAFDWSSCSRNYITNFLDTAQAECLNDPANHTVSIPSEKPGIIYDGTTQCVRMFGKGSRVCDIPDLMLNMCMNLFCEKPDGYCSSNDEPAADGTECLANKWCSYGKCVTKGTKGDPDVDGNWGAWGEWSACYPSCGGGLTKRVRECNNPAPQRGGSLCGGRGTEYRYCNKRCPPNSEHPRMEQCRNKRNVQFEGPIKTFNWIYDPSFVSGSPKCVLSCATTEGDTTSFGSVKDGTPCSDTPNSGVCLRGQCKLIGCDGAVDSRAKLDRCGVCNGDGSSCSVGSNQGNKPKPQSTLGPVPTQSTQSPSTRPTQSTQSPSTRPPVLGENLMTFLYHRVPNDFYPTIAILPAGARNITITEITESSNNLMLKDDYWFDIIDYSQFSPDNLRQDFAGAGTTFWVTKLYEKETITSSGPLNMNLTLLIEVNEPGQEYKVEYRYILTSVEEEGSSGENYFPDRFRLSNEASKYVSDASQFDHKKPETKWIMYSATCSASCGGGIEIVTAVCVRVDDESPVGDQFCEEKRPGNQYKKCNTQLCPAR
ncbi:A disintegrin and metalloproteinase with thrombospondin motifs 6-like isoform X2 [Acropora millepora]|uniref:A disintegrin and metalloproteinase with thrombospondin motifs 6-like isoform X2 n=1 Tax=Acropora millepora TaxID=45264 RepID=UPI001CF168B0|nr:A disintegrin and metalloproteinase with thrombospondin motifs 6-like isoform X2 [Acropora millepora]